MKHRGKRGIFVVLALCLFILPSVPVLAQSGNATLTVSCQGRKGEEESVRLLEGMKVKLFYAAESETEGKNADAFADSGLELGNMDGLSVTELQKLAVSSAEYAEQTGIEGMSAAADSCGNAVFEELSSGVYLVVPQETYYLEEGSFVFAPFFVSILSDGQKTVTVNPKSQWIDGIMIGLENLTVYTGGNETVDSDSDGFPRPRYKGLPDQAVWYVNGERWEGEGYPFEVNYTYAEDGYGVKDSGVTAPDDEFPGVYLAHIKPKMENAVITCITSIGEQERKIVFQDTCLIVRNVDKNKNTGQIGEIVSTAGMSGFGISEKLKDFLAAGLGIAVIPDDAVLTVNGRTELGTEKTENAGLLFDTLLFSGTEQAQNGADVLLRRTADELEAKGRNMNNRQYQGRYLDLISYTDGNLWLSSDLGCEVYWPYPEGTDQNTVFDLVRFGGMFREYEIMGKPDLESLVQTAVSERVTIENTEYGIRFFVPENGFGPFVLSWNLSDKIPVNPNGQPADAVAHDVKTGDNTRIGKYMIFMGSGILVIFLLMYRRRKHHGTDI